MAQKYLKVRPVPGKWYVSEGWRPGQKGWDGCTLSQHQHSGQLDQFLLAGPYETRNDAENWNTQNAHGHAFVWQI